MKTIFVAGTDTGVGKTVIAGLLGMYLTEEKYNVVTQKWVQTGNSGFSKDIKTHLKLMGKKKAGLRHNTSFMSPYTFKHASSPHLSARLEGKKIDIGRIRKSITGLSKYFNTIIIEGSGGLLVPFNERLLQIDIVRQFNLPVLLVSENRLGAINHTLLSIEALRSRGMKIVGVIFNNVSGSKNNLILKDNVRIVKTLSGVKILGILPHVHNLDLLRRRFMPIGKNITGEL